MRPRWRDLWRRLHRLSLATQFMIAATGVVLALMLVLGYWANQRLERSILDTAGDFGAIYIEGFLTRFVQDMRPDGTLPPEVHRELDQRLATGPNRNNIIAVKIWNHDGVVVYSNVKSNIGLRANNTELARAFAGHVVTAYEADHSDDSGALVPIDIPLVEVYTPLRDARTGQIIAVGEFYQLASTLQAEIHRLERATWAIVGAISIPMLGLLFLLVRRGSKRIEAQDLQLRIQLQEAHELAAQNARLRRNADQARVDSTRTNETLLGRIGSDLHDGPVQLLSLLILKLGARSGSFAWESIDRKALAESDGEIRRLAEDIMNELRGVSAGLSLPELEHLTLEEVLDLAVKRHENLTGTEVGKQIGPLPASVSHPVKICVYRIVQEGLSNAVKHAGGVGQRVEARVNDEEIELVVADKGPGLDAARTTTQRSSPGSAEQLGLKGMRGRIRAFGGRLDVQTSREGGTRITAHIPQL